MGFFDPRLLEVVQGGATRGVPSDFAFMKKVEVPLERTPGLGGTPGESSDHPMASGQPNGQKAGLPLSAEMKQNAFILKCLAQVVTLADPAIGDDKGDDSEDKNV